MTKIELHGISTSHKSGAKLDNVSFSINEGEYIAVLGPTGAGPSEILKVVAGLLPVDAGSITFDDNDVTHYPPEDRHVGFVFEQFNLFPHLSVLDNLLYGPRMRRESIEDKMKVAEEVLSMVRLDGREDAISRELSGGMQQRVGIARAITAGAKILLLDQPYRALDAKIRAEMRLEVRNIVKGLGISCIHSTHETEEAFMVADRIAIFNDGKLEQIGTPQEVFNHPVSEFVASFLAESNVWDISISNNKVVLGNQISFDFNHKEYESESYSRAVLRQHAIDLFFNENTIPSSWNHLQGKVTKVRLLGEFIRITVLCDGMEFVVRDLLNPDLKNPLKLVGRDLFIGFPVDELKLF
ncbi:MAG: ABC transporter ATP-binding protein [Candidatus Heimdallarchaeota archaeon]|nr:ABC transporter ATP-binding protein [Candidatus Heimdallarchaeota archaeon]